MNFLDLPDLFRDRVVAFCDAQTIVNLSRSCHDLHNYFSKKVVWTRVLEEKFGRDWKSLFATSFDISISSFSKNVEMYSNFINIIFEHYLPYYYDTTLTNYIPTYAKIYRILSEHVKSRKINRCDPCRIYCLVDEDETQNQVHFQEPEHIKNQKIFDERMERSANKICQICNQEVINKVNYNGDLLPSTDRRFGIFQNCDHIFCIKCVQSWIMTGLCPICLKISPYVIPSEYWMEESDEKSLFFDSFVEKTPKKDYRNYMIGEEATRIFLG